MIAIILVNFDIPSQTSSEGIGEAQTWSLQSQFRSSLHWPGREGDGQNTVFLSTEDRL